MKIQSIVKNLLSAFALVFIFIPNVNADGHAYTIDASNVSQYSDMLTEARAEALSRMEAQAVELGADALVNLRFMTSSVASGASEILAYATAVTTEPS